ncbi:MAG TPA: ATP-binding protein [Nakamurella sp.]
MDALARATGEALRNAELHANGDVIVVEATIDDDGAEISVVDDGRGFDPATVPSGPLGFRQSILARVTEVGGTASVLSTPGAGTTVTLSWRVPAPAGVASRRLADLAGTRNRIVLGATMPILGFVVIQAGLQHGLLSDPRPALLVLAVMTVLTVTAAARVTRHPMTGRRSAILVTAAVVTAIAAGLNLVPGDDVALAYFAAGGGAPALALIAMFRPPWESIVGAAAATAACVVMLLRLSPDGSLLLPALPAVLSNALGVVCLLAGRLTIDHMASSIRRSEELERHAHATAAQLQVSRDVLTARLGRVREWVLPFLIAVQDGRVVLDSPATRPEASTLEAAVRDDIRLGPQIDPAARGLIARARREGRTVEIIADSVVPPALPAGLVSRLLTAALAGPEPPRRTVLTVSAARSRVVSLMVSPVPTEPVLAGVAEQLRARILHGPDFLLVRVDLAAATAVVSPQVGTSVAAAPRIGWAA